MKRAGKTRKALTDGELVLRHVGGSIIVLFIVVWGATVLTMCFSESGRRALEGWTRGYLMHVMLGAFAAMVVLFFVVYGAYRRNWAVLQRHDCMFCPYCAYLLKDTVIRGACPECGQHLHDREFVRKHWELIYDPMKYRPERRNLDGG